jgi:hypothetical protein
MRPSLGLKCLMRSVSANSLSVFGDETSIAEIEILLEAHAYPRPSDKGMHRKRLTIDRADYRFEIATREGAIRDSRIASIHESPPE